MAWLTKSRFLSGLQCPKRLWFEVHQPLEEGLPDSAVFINGRAVDQVAQTLKPGKIISREKGMPAAIAETTRLINSGAPSIMYQPAYRVGDWAVIADVVETREHGVTLTEVKSSTSVKPEHLPDVAFQTLVLRRAGVPIDRALLSHVDRGFELKTAGEYEGLLVEADVTAEVEACLPNIEESARRLQGVMAGARPVVAMGEQCTAPYECPFIERCTAERGGLPEYPVSLLPRGGKTAQGLLGDGYEDLTAVPADRLTSVLHQRVHQATVSGDVYFDAAATASLRPPQYPMSYLDFETIGLAVPEILGTHPYEQWPFQWSVHVEEAPDRVRHAEYLALERLDDLDALAQALLEAIPEEGPIFAYNASFERGVLERMALRLPARGRALRLLAERLVDLLPLTRAAYYHRDMKGSWSIKAVLPTIAPDLDYRELGEVQEGDGAQWALLAIRSGELPPGRREELRKALLEYCERDTWGLVVLRRFLVEGRLARS